ncbi:MAG TPA: helix-turn-helix transcriptional regulator [Methylotenera sp.]
MSKKKLDISPIPLPVEHLLLQWGKAIRAQRQKAQIHMRDFAYRIGVSLDTLQRIEKGESSVQASSYLNAMLTLGILDKLCSTPDEAMMTSTVLRVRKKSKDDDDYF